MDLPAAPGLTGAVAAANKSSGQEPAPTIRSDTGWRPTGGAAGGALAYDCAAAVVASAAVTGTIETLRRVVFQTSNLTLPSTSANSV